MEDDNSKMFDITAQISFEVSFEVEAENEAEAERLGLQLAERVVYAVHFERAGLDFMDQDYEWDVVDVRAQWDPDDDDEDDEE